MKCQILFSGKNLKNIINLLSAEFAHSTESINDIKSIVTVLKLKFRTVTEILHQFF